MAAATELRAWPTAHDTDRVMELLGNALDETDRLVTRWDRMVDPAGGIAADVTSPTFADAGRLGALIERLEGQASDVTDFLERLKEARIWVGLNAREEA
jgi:hypothetical protein